MLKLNQQTVRNWIDQGSLPALRVGRRVRIKRSDFERILERVLQRRAPRRRAGRRSECRGLLGRRAGRAWPSRVRAPDRATGRHGRRRRMSFGDDLDRQRAQIMRAVRQAGDDWAEAMRAHKLAPPDAGFAARLARRWPRRPADEQVAWEHAHAAGLMWRPIPGAENAEPPYELRPGTGRRGPAELWARFDAAVAGLNRAITGSTRPRSPMRSASCRRPPARWPTRSPPRTRPARGRGSAPEPPPDSARLREPT